MHTIESGDITKAAEAFLCVSEGEEPSKNSRSRSWDYCYNYFQDNPEPTQDMERSCLQLGYYLASWGMLRGSTYLFNETNMRHYAAAISLIEDLNPRMRSIDADAYSDPDTQENIISAFNGLRHVLVPKGVSYVTLVGKVMLGVWGTLPSFDTYFQHGFWTLADKRGERTAFSRVDNHSLNLLADFYDSHREEIAAVAARYPTLSFEGDFTDRPLPFAKVIDMYGFQRGYEAGLQSTSIRTDDDEVRPSHNPLEERIAQAIESSSDQGPA